jgi:prepilin-type N-terminal cleavage/methylation domain-containing protein
MNGEHFLRNVLQGKQAIRSHLGPSSDGFTLLELIVVLFIISFFLAMVTPSFYSWSEGRTKTEPKLAASIIRYIHDSAINAKKPMKLSIDMDSHNFVYETPEGEKTAAFGSLSSVEIPSHGNIRKGSIKLMFDVTGHPEPFNVYFKGNMYLTYNPFSGMVNLLNRDDD